MTILSLADARAIQLAAQDLLSPPKIKATPASVLATIRQMQLLQIDTISVVARSPYLVLWSRLGNYAPAWLDQLLAEGKLFEYWAHEACFLPIEDYPLMQQRMHSPQQLGWKYAHQWISKHPEIIERVKAHIRTHGPMRSIDFASEGLRKASSGWWERKPEKRALEALFTMGELMIAKRQNFQRVYDLAERIVPDAMQSAPPLSEAASIQACIENSVKALGIGAPEWIADYYRLNKRQPQLTKTALSAHPQLIPVMVEGQTTPWWMHVDQQPLLEKALAGTLKPTLTTLLSPFDPLVWDRQRAKTLFGFDYRLECYTPAPKRQFGYFVLPILHEGQLIGRLDAKAHRQQGIMEIRACHLEPQIKAGKRMVGKVAKAIQSFADWHQTPKIRWLATEESSFCKQLRESLAGASFANVPGSSDETFG